MNMTVDEAMAVAEIHAASQSHGFAISDAAAATVALAAEVERLNETVQQLGQALNVLEWENKKLRGLINPMKTALYRWENGHAFDNHGADRELQRRLEQ